MALNNVPYNPFYTIPSTRQISWQAEVVVADANWTYDYNHPVVYEFSNGRKFQAPYPLYTS